MMLMNAVDNPLPITHFAILNEKFKEHALSAFNLLVESNFSVFWNFKYNLKKSLSKASETKAKYIIIIGEEEFNLKKYKIKNLNTGEQNLFGIESILNFIK